MTTVGIGCLLAIGALAAEVLHQSRPGSDAADASQCTVARTNREVSPLAAGSSLAGDQGANFERRYAKGLELTPEQERCVLALVKRRGITNVAEVCTDYTHPSSERGIGVKEKETVRKRQVQYKMAWLVFSPRNPDEPPGQTLITPEDFRVAGIRNQTFTLLSIGPKQYRARLEGGIAASNAERFLALLLRGQFTFGPEVKTSEMEGADFAKTYFIGFIKKLPAGLAQESGSIYQISCGHTDDPFVTFSIFFRRTQGRLIILEVHQIIV
jgi:hypothetical protein